MELKDATLDHAWSCKVREGSEGMTTVIADGMGDEQGNRRPRQLRSRLRSRRRSTPSLIKRSCRSVLQSLAGGVAVIRVGAATETEMKEAKLRMRRRSGGNKSSCRRGHHLQAAVLLTSTLAQEGEQSWLPAWRATRRPVQSWS